MKKMKTNFGFETDKSLSIIIQSEAVLEDLHEFHAIIKIEFRIERENASSVL